MRGGNKTKGKIRKGKEVIGEKMNRS